MKKIINLFLVGVLATGLSSCLKDDTMIGPDSPGAIKNVIEFANPDFINSPTSSNYPVYVKSFDIAPTGKLTLTVNYAGVDDAPQDIQVKVALDPAVLTAYNAKIVKDARDKATELGEDPDEAEEDVQGDLFEALDPALYSLGNMDIVIPAGKRTASLDVDLKPDQFSFEKNTALAFKIVSASTGTISGNFGNIIVQIGAKNAYDGAYTLKTSATTSLVPNANKSVTLSTVSATAVKLSPGLLGSYTNEVIYTINPTTNAVTVTCPSLGVQEPQDTRSKWDPATKTLTVFWKQAGGGRTFEETFVYKGAR
jgi:hypothetical protein